MIHSPDSNAVNLTVRPFTCLAGVVPPHATSAMFELSPRRVSEVMESGII